MTLISDVLQTAGIRTYCMEEWQGTDDILTDAFVILNGRLPQTADEAHSLTADQIVNGIAQIWQPLGVRVWPSYNFSGVPSWYKTELDALDRVKFANLGNLSINGYAPQDGPLIAAHPEATNYAYFKDPVTGVGTLYAQNGVVVDFFDLLLAKWKAIMDNMAIGRSALTVGVTTAPFSDVPVDIGIYASTKTDYRYTTGGHNLLTYARFVKTVHFTNSVDATGKHIIGGTTCKLYQHYISLTTVYTLFDLAADVHDNHITPGASFQQYQEIASALLELAIAQYLSSLLGHTMILRHSHGTRSTLTAPPPELLAIAQYNLTVLGGQMQMFSQEGGIGTSAFVDVGASYYQNLANPAVHQERMSKIYLDDIPQVGAADQVVFTTWGQNTYGLWNPFLPIANDPMLPTYRHFGSLLNRMKFVGGHFGTENTPLRLLSAGQGATFSNGYAQFYAIAKQYGIGNTTDLSTVDLTKFDVIYLSGGNYVEQTNSSILAIKTFVQNGGGLVLDFDRWTSPLWSDILGITQVAPGAPSSQAVPNPAHPILKPYGASVGPAYAPFLYGNNNPQQSPLGHGIALSATNLEQIVVDSNNGPVITVNHLGLGRAVSIPLQGAYSLASASLLNNAIIYAAKKEALGPAYYSPVFEMSNPYPWLRMSICGKKPGTKLIWLGNGDRATVPHRLPLNFSTLFYNFPASWIAYDINQCKVVSKGTGDVTIDWNVPAKDWSPIYIDSAV